MIASLRQRTRRDGPLLRLAASVLLLEAGASIAIVALPLLLIERYGLGLEMGIVLGVRVVAGVLLGPFAGAIVDRGDARRIAAVSALAGALAAVATPSATAIWQLQALVLLTGASFLLGIPAQLALRPQVMAPGTELAGNALLVTGERLALLLGPLLAAPLIAAGSVASAFYLEAGLTVAAAALLRRLPTERPGPRRATGRHRLLRAWTRRAGIDLRRVGRLIARDGVLAAFVVHGLTYMAAVGIARIMLAALATSRFAGEPGMLGYLLAAMGAGGVLGGTLGARLRGSRIGLLYVVLNTAEALCWLALPFAGATIAALALVFAAGLVESTTSVVYFAETQVRLGDRLLGRWWAMMVPLGDACLMAGTALGAPLVAAWGVKPAAAAIAALIALPVLALARSLATLRTGVLRA